MPLLRAALTTTVVVLLAFYAPVVVLGATPTSVPVYPITIPTVPGQAFPRPPRRLSTAPDGRIVVSVGQTSPLIVDYDIATGKSRLVAGNVSTEIPRYVHGGFCDFNETLKATTPDTIDPAPEDVAFGQPIGIDAIGGEGNQVILGNSMPVSNLMWFGRTSPFSKDDRVHARRFAGQRCYYIQKNEEQFIAEINAAAQPVPLARHFPPVSSVKYRASTGELYVAFDRTIVLVRNAGAGANGTIEHYYGLPAPLPSPVPAPWDNRTTEIPITKPPMKSSVSRLDALSGSIGQMAILNDEYLVVPDGLNAAVRLVNFGTSLVTVATSATDGLQFRPDYPCLETAAGCPTANFSVFGADATATYGRTGIFVAGRTFTTVVFIDIATATARYVTGRTPQDVVNGVAGVDTFMSIIGLGITTVTMGGTRSDLLIIGSSKGVFYANVSDIPAAAGIAPAVPVNPATAPKLCGVWSTCNGHATTAVGTPMTGCECTCKRGWTGPACDIKPRPLLTATRSLSRSYPTLTKSLDLPLPVKAQPIPAVEAVATTSVVVTTSIAGVTGTPTVATQGGRATVLLNLQVCDVELGEPFEFAESPTFLAVGTSKLRYAAGAVVGNYVAIGGVLAIQYVIVLFVGWKKGLQPLDAQALVRFPSIGAFPLLFTAEGTAYASTLLIWHGGSDVTLRMLGVIGLVGVIAIVVAFAVFMKLYFRATYDLYPHALRRLRRQNADGTDATAPAGGAGDRTSHSVQWPAPEALEDPLMIAGADEAPDAHPGRDATNLQSFVLSNPSLVLTQGTLFERFQSLARWLLDVQGKWRETGTHQTKRFGGLFMDYRPGMQAFALAELGMAVGTGMLAAVKPLHCRTIITLIMAMYIGLFLLVVALRPADNRYTKYMMTAVTGLQALSSVLILAADVTKSSETADIARDVLFSSMFLVGIMSLIDACTRIYHIAKYIARTKTASRRVANATFIDGDAPLLERPTPAGGSGNSLFDPLSAPPANGMAGSILSHPTPLSQPDREPHSPPPARSGMGGRVVSAADFTNFSFTAADVTPPTPRTNMSALRTPTPNTSQQGSQGSQGMGSPSPSNTSFARGGGARQPNQTLEQLRAELDDLLTGRTSQTGRLDELLEAARAESSTSGSRGNGSSGEPSANASMLGRHRRSMSNLTNALTTPSTDRPPRYPSNRSLTGFAEALVRGNSTDFNTSSGTATTNSSLVRRRGNEL